MYLHCPLISYHLLSAQRAKGILDREIRIWSEECFTFLCGWEFEEQLFLSLLNFLCNIYKSIFNLWKRMRSNIWGAQLDFSGARGGTQLERVEGERFATPQNAIVYCTLHSSTAPKSLKDLPRHSCNWGPAIELPPYPPNIPGISNPGMALGSDFILSQSMKSQVDYSWSIMRKHLLRQTPINYWM